MKIEEAIGNRRSIHKFKDKEVEWRKISMILDAGRLAPSSGNLQSTRFIVVEDEKVKEKVTMAALKQNFINQAPIVIVVIDETSEVKSYYSKRADRYLKQNSAAAIQNILLMTHAVGLAGCWVGAFEEGMVKKALKLPNNVNVAAILPIGYSDEKVKMPRRVDLKDLVYFDEYKGKKDISFFPLTKHFKEKKKKKRFSLFKKKKSKN